MARMMNGYWVFQAPMGYRYERVAGHNKLLVRNEPVASLIQEALEGFAYGRFASQADVKRFLETHPDFPKGSQKFLHPQRITDLLTRPIYAGYITHENWNLHPIKAKHEPLIDYVVYQKIQERRASKHVSPRRSDINEDFPLRGFVSCADCSEPLTAAWSKGRNKRYPYYACDTRGCASSRKSIRRADIEGDFEALLKRIVPARAVFEMATAMFKRAWEMNQASEKQRMTGLKKALSTVERDLAKTLDRLIDTDEPNLIKAYERKIKALEEKRAETEAALNNSGPSKGTFEGNYRTAMTFLANP